MDTQVPHCTSQDAVSMHEQLRKEKAIINLYLHGLDLSHRFLSHVASSIKIRKEEKKVRILSDPAVSQPSRREAFPF